MSVGRKSQTPLSGKFASFRVKPVFGEICIPLECVILEGGGNAELRSWRPFGQLVNTIRRVSPKSVVPEHALNKENCHLHTGWCSTQQARDGGPELRGAKLVVEESSSLVPSSLKHEGDGGHGQSLSERARRLSERTLPKGLEGSRRPQTVLCKAGNTNPVTLAAVGSVGQDKRREQNNRLCRL